MGQLLPRAPERELDGDILCELLMLRILGERFTEVRRADVLLPLLVQQDPRRRDPKRVDETLRRLDRLGYIVVFPHGYFITSQGEDALFVLAARRAWRKRVQQ